MNMQSWSTEAYSTQGQITARRPSIRKGEPLRAIVKKYNCHVCGYPELTEKPWGEDGKTDNQQICPCCGVQFGYEDRTPEAINAYRRDWIKNDAKWLMESHKPYNWSPVKQLANIHLRLEDL